MFPAEGQIDVPVDAVIVTRFAPPLHLTEVETGSERALDREVLDGDGEWFVARPVMPLRAHTRYSIALGDHEAAFATGAFRAFPLDALDVDALRFAAWTDVEVTSSCDEPWIDEGAGRRGRRTYACVVPRPLPADVVMLSYTFTPVSSAGEPFTEWIAPIDADGGRRWPTLLTTHTCDVRAPPFRPGESWRLEVVAWNGAFRPTGSEPVSSSVEPCEAVDRCENCPSDAPGTAPALEAPAGAAVLRVRGSGCSAAPAQECSASAFVVALVLAVLGSRRPAGARPPSTTGAGARRSPESRSLHAGARGPCS